MPSWNDLLLRDSLSDDGSVPSLGYPSQSPDVICTQQTSYADPQAQFGSATSYANGNLCKPVIGRQNNYFYVRAKNLGSSATGGRLYFYWANANLGLLPSTWINNAMYIQLPPPSPTAPPPPPQYYCDLPSVGQNGVTVTPLPFIWNPTDTTPHYCTIGVCSTPAHPWSPSNPPVINSWDDFVNWVRNNQTVCWRNVQLIANPNVPEWDTTAGFQNPYSTTPPLLFQVICSNVPVNTSVNVLCTAIGLNYTTTVTDPNMTILTPGVTCPAHFQGVVETRAQTPGGSAWPSNASLTTAAWIGSTNVAHPAAKWDRKLGRHSLDAKHPRVAAAYDMMGGGVLLCTGTNTLAAAPSSSGIRARGRAR